MGMINLISMLLKILLRRQLKELKK